MKQARKITPFCVRLPHQLKQWLIAQAEANRRSLNSEIVHRLETAYGDQQQATQGGRSNG